MSGKQELRVRAIENGTVIDHLPSENIFRIALVLDLKENDSEMLLGMNLGSSKMGKKSIIKVANRFFSQKEINQIALLAPKAVINIIKDYKVKEKIRPEFPEMIDNIVYCPNANCITNHDKVESRFHVENRKPLELRCHYCERSIAKDDISLL